VITQDLKAWGEGFKAGEDGQQECPYPAGSREALSWCSGHVEGDRERLEADREGYNGSIGHPLGSGSV
jgi:hypothetical protein